MNAHISNFGSGGHRATYRKIRIAWRDDIGSCMLLFKVPKAKVARQLILTRVLTGLERIWDYDNLVGGMKPVLDACKLAGLIIDDSHAWLQCEYRQQKGEAGAVSGLRFEIAETSVGDS